MCRIRLKKNFLIFPSVNKVENENKREIKSNVYQHQTKFKLATKKTN